MGLLQHFYKGHYPQECPLQKCPLEIKFYVDPPKFCPFVLLLFLGFDLRHEHVFMKTFLVNVLNFFGQAAKPQQQLQCVITEVQALVVIN